MPKKFVKQRVFGCEEIKLYSMVNIERVDDSILGMQDMRTYSDSESSFIGQNGGRPQ